MMDRVIITLPNGGFRIGMDSKIPVKPGTVFDLEGVSLEVETFNADIKQNTPAAELIPFDLEAAKAGAALVTRDGRKVRFLAHVPEALSSCRVLAYIELESGAREFTESGKAKPHTGEASDLFIAPKPKRTVWVNFFKGAYAYHFADEKTARVSAERSNGYELIATAVPIEIDA